MTAKLAFQDRVEERAHLVLFAGGLELDPAIAQVADGAGNVEPLRYLPDRITEADALDVAFIKDLNGCRHAPED